MKRLKCKKAYGLWQYEKIEDYDLDAPIYELYDEHGAFVSSFGSYGDMKYYVETGGAYL